MLSDTLRARPEAAAEPVGDIPFGQRWWKIFGSPTLDSLEEMALNANRGIQIAVDAIDQANAQLSIAHSAILPNFTFTPNYSRQGLSANRASQTGSSVPLNQFSYSTFSLPINASYEIDLWGQIRQNIAAAKLNVAVSKDQYEVVRLGVVTNVATNYFNVAVLDAQDSILRATVAKRKQNVDLVDALFKAGINTALDVNLARTELASAQVALVEVARQRAVVVDAIAVLCSQPTYAFSLPRQRFLRQPPAIPLAMPSELLLRRPDVAAVERQIAAQNELIGVAKNNFFPQLLITGNAGFLSKDATTLIESKSAAYLGTVGISVPIFTGGANKARLQSAKILYDQALLNYKAIVAVAFQDVQDAIVNLDLRADEVQLQTNGLLSARNSAALSRELYSKGLVPYINVVDADRSVLDAENTLLGIQVQRQLYTILLIKALGGGWQPQ